MLRKQTAIRHIVLIGIMATCSLAHAQKKKRDQVYRVGGGVVVGEIKQLSPDGVSINEKGSVQNIALDEIKKIRFDDEPSNLSKIRNDIEEGQVEQAGKALAKLKVRGGDYVKQDVEYYKAMLASRSALQGNGNLTEAAKQMNRFLKAYPSSLRYYGACEVMGDLAKSLGKLSTAANYYDRISKSKSPGVAARGNVLQGDALFLQDKVSAALQKYQAASRASDATLKGLAQVGVAKCQAAGGNHAAAIQQIEKLIAGNSSESTENTELFARASNAMGYAYQQAGNADAALESYLKTDLLFYRDRTQHAEALYHLGRLWSGANKPAESSKARRKLKEFYGASLWAKK